MIAISYAFDFHIQSDYKLCERLRKFICKEDVLE
jgi:hypothetical protein